MVTWDIQRDERAWGDEARSRYQMTPEKTEMVGGRLYGTEEERLTMLALLLENVGADKAVRLGNASTWRGAVAALNEEHEDQETEAPVLPEAERDALETALLANARAQHEALKELLDESSDHWGFEDPVASIVMIHLLEARVASKSRFRSAMHLRAGRFPGRSPDILVESRERSGLGESVIAR